MIFTNCQTAIFLPFYPVVCVQIQGDVGNSTMLWMQHLLTTETIQKIIRNHLGVTDCHFLWITVYKDQCKSSDTNLNSAAIFIGISSPVEESLDWQVHLMKPCLLSTAGQRHQTVGELRTSLFEVLSKVIDDLSTIVGRTLTPAVTRKSSSPDVSKYI